VHPASAGSALRAPLGHVPLSASEAGKPTAGSPYDFFHINSIQQLPDGNLLVSARNSWGVYEISRSTGKIIWTPGGKDSSFKMGAGTQFEWQHDARLQPNGTLTLFDDAASPAEESESRAITLRLDTTTMRASLERSYPRAEARKCVLLCSNCHAEVEDEMAVVPLEFQSGPTDPMHHNPG
jgi:Arylsulfotransferase (ASST)